MKKIGILGGVGWLSTVDYYSQICRRSEERHMAGKRGDACEMPEMSIESLDHTKAVAFIGNEQDDASWSRFDQYHHHGLERLEKSGAEFAIIASNTPHHRFGAIVHGIRIPVLHIAEAMAKECARIECDRALILGTLVVMDSAEFRKAFAGRGIEAAGPRSQAAREEVVELIDELQRGRIGGAAQRIGRIAQTCWAEQFTGSFAVCLACTELPLAFPRRKAAPSFTADGITYVNSSAAHVAAAFEFALAD